MLPSMPIWVYDIRVQKSVFIAIAQRLRNEIAQLLVFNGPLFSPN